MNQFLPTKGIEYLMSLGYLALLVPFWWLVFRSRAAASPARVAAGRAGAGWFRVPEGFLFHRGHTWALPEGEGVYRVGLDDFAQGLLGPAEALRLPLPGTRLEQGDRGWGMRVEGQDFDLLSPVQGEVLEVNPEAEAHPEVVSADPYGRGWLMRVRAARPQAALKNLLPRRLARSMMEEASARLGGLMGGDLGVVLQDGGVPVSGFARQLDRERWVEVARELLLAPGP